MRDADPVSLSTEVLRLDSDPLTRPPSALPIRVWVRYRDTDLEVDGEVVAWTDRVAAVRWPIGDGKVHRAWVWSSAVTRRPI